MNRDTLIVVAAAVAVTAAVAAAGAWFANDSQVTDPGATAREQATSVESEIAALQREVATDPTRVSSWRALGRRYMATGRFLEAVEAWSVVAELRPGDAEAAAAFAQLDEIAASRGRHQDQGQRPPSR